MNFKVIGEVYSLRYVTYRTSTQPRQRYVTLQHSGEAVGSAHTGSAEEGKRRKRSLHITLIIYIYKKFKTYMDLLRRACMVQTQIAIN